MDLDMSKLEALLGTVVNELGAASNAALVILGDKLGLFRTLAEGMMTSAELAKRTGTHERYVREWLSAQAASGFVTYHKDHNTFSMTPEQAAVFADDESTVYMTGGFHSIAAVFANEPEVLLMDEPFVGLDYARRASLHGVLLDLWRDSGRTVFFITHDVDEALALGDRMLVVISGDGGWSGLVKNTASAP